MRIYSMTATFGKLEHATLTLEPGLNIIQAPNEWGKSTWCAFLLAMLYGLDTRAKATRSGPPEKERYAPWSGSPMSGRIELNWQGRDITIERSTKGRIPLGSFRAYETETGLAVPELDGANCGQMLLGVERSVFQRAGFIRLSDLPVTQDDALKTRLISLVTTGDDSGDGARLEKGLRELKNRCRYNRSGLLPQAIQQRSALRTSLEELDALQSRQEKIARELEENRANQALLSNHLAALSHRQYRRDQEKVAHAQEALAQAKKRRDALEAQCALLPEPDEIEQKLSQLSAHREALEAFQEQQHALPLPPELPKPPDCFLGMDSGQALAQAEADGLRCRKWKGKGWRLVLGLGIAALAAAGVLFYQKWMLPGALVGAAGGVAAILSAVQLLLLGNRRRALTRRYGSPAPDRWREMAAEYAREMEDYRRREEEYRRSREALALRRQELKQMHQQLAGTSGLEQQYREWERLQRQWDALKGAELEAQQAEREYQTLKAMLRPAPAPTQEDSCVLDSEETARQLRLLREQEQLLGSREGECRGKMEVLGSRKTLEDRLHQLDNRIRELETYEAALVLAQQTLAQASEALQRRFAPRISREAQQLLSRLTGGKYNRLLLEADFSLLSGASREDTLRSAQWRSDGTMDQLYLALRLSTAQALTPEAPLILDDALVRFDDQRLEAAMEVLRELADTRQVIVFTCQHREKSSGDGPAANSSRTLAVDPQLLGPSTGTAP